MSSHGGRASRSPHPKDRALLDRIDRTLAVYEASMRLRALTAMYRRVDGS